MNLTLISRDNSVSKVRDSIPVKVVRNFALHYSVQNGFRVLLTSNSLGTKNSRPGQRVTPSDQ